MTLTSQRPHLLILGWNEYVLRACAEANFGATVVCSPGLLFAREDADAALYDHLIVVDDHTDIGNVLMGLARAGLGETRFSGIYTSEDPMVVHAAVLARVLETRGMKIDVAINFRDKVIQKRRIAEAGIATPRAIGVDDLSKALEHLDGTRFPVVLKPVAAMMASGFKFVPTVDALAETLDQAASADGPVNYILEEFVDGDEWHCDGFVEGGELGLLSVSEYAQPAREAISGETKRAVTLDPKRQAWAYELATPLVMDSLRALGMETGVFHLEVFLRPDGTLAFGECAARAGGAIIVPTVCRKFGIDLHRVGLTLAAGGSPQLGEIEVTEEAVGYVQLPMPAGRLVSPPSAAEVEALPGVVHANLNMKPGYCMPEDRPHSSFRVGEAIVVGEDESELRRRLDAVAEWTLQNVEVAPTGAL